jgi:peptidoglycan hydrolase CwlO-like protein
MSDELNKDKELTKLEKEFINKGEQNFITEVRRASFEELDNKIKELAKHRESIQDTMKQDPELKELQEKLKELKAPYVEQRKWNSKKARMVYLVMTEEYPTEMEAFGGGKS